MARSARDHDDDEAPWLAEVESDGHGATLVERGRLIGGVTLFVLLLLLVVIGIYVITQTKQDGASGTPVARAEDAPLITADPGPYKVRPADPGGLELDESGNGIYSAGNGDDPQGTISTSRLPEEPGPRPGEAPVALIPDEGALPPIPPPAGTPAPKAAAAPPVAVPPAPLVPKPAAPALPKAAPKPGAATVPVTRAPVAAPAPVAAAAAPGGTVLQLGAFSSAGKAESAWKSLTQRFAYLAPLSKRIEPVERDTGTLYRLRATGSPDAASAAQTCKLLRVAGETCVVVP